MMNDPCYFEKAKRASLVVALEYQMYRYLKYKRWNRSEWEQLRFAYTLAKVDYESY